MSSVMKKLVFPKSLGGLADLLYTLQQTRLEKSREVRALEEQEAALSEHILKNVLPTAGLQGARGNVGQISIKPYDYVEVTDWDKLWAYVGKHKSWELMQQKVKVTALREIWEAGKSVPGAEQRHGEKLHVSKVSGK